MNILVLNPKSRKLRYSFFTNGKQAALNHDHICYTQDAKNLMPWEFLLRHIAQDVSHTVHKAYPSAIAIRVVFGASEFKGPIVVTESVIQKLESLIPRAPMHLPVILNLIRACKSFFQNIPIVLVFETAFFTSLPPREHKYALDNSIMLKSGFRRYGYRGIFHQAACRFVQSETSQKERASSLRILSICLDPHPEITAVTGNCPVMITSGSTPLEGLPGERSSGEIDPSIVMTLANEKKWGPEKINEVLASESGLYGLIGKHVSLSEVITSDAEEYRLAQNLFKYRLTLACGAGIAALGGLDVIVFSGGYINSAPTIEKWLKKALNFPGGLQTDSITFTTFSDSLDRIIADNASFALLQKKAV